MPIVRVEAFPGRTLEQKRKLSRAITEALHEHFGARREGVIVLFQEVSTEDYASGGVMWCDREGKHESGQPRQ